MSTDEWARVQALFEDVADLLPEDRAVVLAAYPDADVRREVEALLAADAATGPLDALHDAVAPLTQGWRPSTTPTVERYGPYQIVRPLGVGGMGAVYLAERADGAFEQQVALKLLPPALATPERERRFRAERQVLARLDHPGIARLLDGGVAPGGQPWFAMEYVEGVPLTTYCQTHALGLRDRLRLLLDVCTAVDYAHQNLIVHRDLKPSNILVRATPDGPQVKLLDFGIAKLLDAEGTGDALTVGDQRLMTPDYAAPEQVRGEPVTTATDVYALGVLLYELLTGQRPYDVRGLTPSQWERVVCEETPTRPSQMIAQVAAAQAAASLGPLPADLDVLVLTCLEKDPARRYSSAALLRRDVQRFLEGRTLFARPPSAAYQVRLFLRRNRLLAMAAALVLLALLGGLATTLWQAQRATAQAARAEAEARKAQQVSAFLLDVFRVADPDEALGDTITAREILDAGARRVRQELRDQPDVQATVLGVIGQVYQNLGLFDQAEPLLTEALALRTTTPGIAPADRAESLQDLASLRREQGRYDTADSLYRLALPLLEGDRTARPALAQAYARWALIHQQTGRYDASDSLFQRAFTTWERLPAPDTLAQAEARLHYASLLSLMGRYPEAETAYLEALRVRRAHFGPDHPETVNAENNFAVYLYDAGRHDEAEPLYRHVLAVRRKVYGDHHPDVANAMNNLAALLADLGRYDEAESLYAQSLQVMQTHYGPSHPEVSFAYGNLAYLAYRQGAYPQALDGFERALAIQQRVFGLTHMDVGLTRQNLAWTYRALGDDARAEAEYRAALALFLQTVGPQHLQTNIARASLASLLETQDRRSEAIPLYRDAIAALQATFPEGHPSLALNQSRLGDLLVRTGRPAEAEPLLRAALGFQTENLDADHVARLTTLRRLADALIAQRNRAAAQPVLDEALRLQRTTATPDPDLQAELDASIRALRALR